MGDNLLPSSGASITQRSLCRGDCLSSPPLRSGGPSCVLGVKGKVLAIDPPHELRAKFDRLFEFLFGLAI